MNKAIQTLEFNICKGEICNQHKCSNAFWIVEKFAFPSGVINNAKRYLMTNEKNKAASYITEKDKENPKGNEGKINICIYNIVPFIL